MTPADSCLLTAQQHFNPPESERSCQAYDKPNAGNPQESESEDPGESDASEMVCSHSRMIVHLLRTMLYTAYELAGFTGSQRPQRLKTLKDRARPKILNAPRAPQVVDMKPHHSFKKNRHYRHSLIELPWKQDFFGDAASKFNFLIQTSFCITQFSDVPVDLFHSRSSFTTGKILRRKTKLEENFNTLWIMSLWKPAGLKWNNIHSIPKLTVSC